MSSTTTDFPGEQQPRPPPWSADYIPTEEESRVLNECRRESILYRALPLSVISMAVTQAVDVRGNMSQFFKQRAIPRLAIAGFCGYLLGMQSYMDTCKEKFKRLENSPMGETLRQFERPPQQHSRRSQSGLSDTDTQSLDPMFQPGEAPSQMPSYARDYEHGFRPEPPMQMERVEDYSAPASNQSYKEEEEPKKKSILYEDLRLKNRENYEVTLTQRAETLLKSQTEREQERPKIKAKKNIYGDVWEE